MQILNLGAGELRSPRMVQDRLFCASAFPDGIKNLTNFYMLTTSLTQTDGNQVLITSA